MAEGLLRQMAGDRYEVFSAGTRPVGLNPNAVEALAEIGIDISNHRSKSVEEFAGQEFDYVVTVCDNARETCPIFPGTGERLHHSFQDPAAMPPDEQLPAFRTVRDEIASWLKTFVGEVEQYRPAVTRYIRYLVRDAAEAEDLAQETFLRAHQRSATLRDAGALESWLYQIATHIAIDRIRQRERVAKRIIEQPADELPIEDRKQSPLQIVGQREMSTCVQRYVARLSDQYRAVLLMHDADGLTATESAALLELPLTTVKMRLHRARRQLQALLNEACAFDHDDRGVFVCAPKPHDRD